MVQLNPTLAWPWLVVRLREAVPPRAQMLMNSFTDAVRNWEFSLEDIFDDKDDVLKSELMQQGLPCELVIY